MRLKTMPNDVKVARPELSAAEGGCPAPTETSQAGNPVPTTVIPAQDSAGGQTSSERCRACLGALAHRLAQPATALRGGMELALLGKRSVSEYRSVLEQSLKLADHMVQLIVSLRDLAESSAPAGLPQSVAFDQVVRGIQAEVQELAESREIRFQLTAEDAAHICVDPGRLREALQNLLVWIIQNSTGAGVIETEISASNGEAQVSLLPARWDLQYLQIQMLEDIANPGLLFSQAATNGAMGWAINRRLVEALGGKLEIVTEGPDTGCVRARFPLAPAP
jgi:light-regulated signal transduction histidine kinase (bacteriophytochrome)